jgi:hypothetical protein
MAYIKLPKTYLRTHSMSTQIEKFFFDRLQVNIKQFMAAPTEEARNASLTAIRRCKAIVAKDYKALWEDVEGILLDVRADMDRMQMALDKEKELVRQIIRTLLV